MDHRLKGSPVTIGDVSGKSKSVRRLATASAPFRIRRRRSGWRHSGFRHVSIPKTIFGGLRRGLPDALRRRHGAGADACAGTDARAGGCARRAGNAHGKRRDRAAADRGGGAQARPAAATAEDAGHHRATPRNARRAAADRGAGGRRPKHKNGRGAAQHRRADRRQFLRGQPPGHRGAAARRQHDARQGAAADPGRLAGFGRQRRTARPQRARQSAIPHQRHHAAGRRRRLRPDSRYRNHRQPFHAYRGAAGAIWPAHRRRARYPDQGGRLQQFGQRQRLWRQPRNGHDVA